MKQNIAGTNLIEGIGTIDEQRESRPNDEKVYILKNVEQGIIVPVGHVSCLFN